MRSGEKRGWLVLLALLVGVCRANVRVPNSSKDDVVDQVCSGEKGNCENDNFASAGDWKPFQITQKSKWISFDKMVERYAEWHGKALRDEEIPCEKKRILVFTPNAGLGDSIGALTTAFIYTIRSGRLFFIDWQPFPWSAMFKDLPFDYDYRKAANMNSKSQKPLICPNEDDRLSFLSGHITAEHPLTDEAKAQTFQTDYRSITSYFLNPATEVEKIMSDIVEGPFKSLDEKGTTLQKVAIVMRTGIAEYNQFLSVGDEVNFVKCFQNYARAFTSRRENKNKAVKFAVFVTSDNAEAKRNAVDALEKMRDELNADVVTLEDSAVHVMHVTREESRQIEVRKKLRKTIAEFFLIGMCDARFLTHGSLFGRSAAERGGGPEGRDFFISDSNCDGEREKHSYLQCHTPKYPPICGIS